MSERLCCQSIFYYIFSLPFEDFSFSPVWSENQTDFLSSTAQSLGFLHISNSCSVLLYNLTSLILLAAEIMPFLTGSITLIKDISVLYTYFSKLAITKKQKKVPLPNCRVAFYILNIECDPVFLVMTHF